MTNIHRLINLAALGSVTFLAAEPAASLDATDIVDVARAEESLHDLSGIDWIEFSRQRDGNPHPSYMGCNPS